MPKSAQAALAAATALSVLLHLAAFSFRLSGGGALSSPVHAGVPLAVRLIPLARRESEPPQVRAASPAVRPRALEPRTLTPATPASPKPLAARQQPARAVTRSESPLALGPASTAAAIALTPPPAVAAEPAVPRPTGVAPAIYPGYAAAAGLDPPPRPLDDIAPDFPEAAGMRGGSVVLRLFINETGGVDRIEVVRSTPPGLFDAAALAAFGTARYSPGFLAGVPVRSQVMYEVEFARQARDSSASGRTY